MLVSAVQLWMRRGPSERRALPSEWFNPRLRFGLSTVFVYKYTVTKDEC